MESTNRQVRNTFLRWALVVCGWLAVAAGIVGIFLPLIPTVPFLLLAVACFARSSERFHSWLVEHNHLGPLLHDYLKGSGIPLRAKAVAVCMVWVSFPATTILLARDLWLKALLISAAIGITLYLLFLPTAMERNRHEKQGEVSPVSDAGADQKE